MDDYDFKLSLHEWKTKCVVGIRAILLAVSLIKKNHSKETSDRTPME
jgi:hypothetical protein